MSESDTTLEDRVEELLGICREQQKKIEKLSDTVQSVSKVAENNHEMHQDLLNMNNDSEDSIYDEYNLSEDEVNQFYR